jgi:hypothetical protein
MTKSFQLPLVTGWAIEKFQSLTVATKSWRPNFLGSDKKQIN